MWQNGYYRILRDHGKQDYAESGFKAGALAQIVIHGDEANVFIGHCHFKYDLSDGEFDADFEYAPNGAAERQSQIAQLMAAMHEDGNQQQKLQKQLETFSPYAIGDQVATGTDLVPAGGMAGAKLAMAGVRNSVGKAQLRMERNGSRLNALLAEQKAASELQLKSLKGLLAKAEEAVWSINLYLGKNEEIKTLQTGQPESPDTPITIAQRVLYMDEECGIVLGDSGIDVNSLYLFDEWVVKSRQNLDRVLPHAKGVVALHPRRYVKKYNDPYYDTVANEANLKWTYLLIRNGENLYRVCVDVNAGSNLFPMKDDFAGLFDGLKPGSKDYMRAVESANEANRHYLRIVLVLQGLLDRTDIFKPMPLDRVNLCDPSHCSEYVVFKYQDDRTVLTDGKPAFHEWQDQINSKLDVGCRIVGHFGYKLRGGEYTDSRLYPANSCYPSDDELHVISGKENVGGDDRFFFTFTRHKDEVLDRGVWRYRPCKTKGRCWVELDDDFFLNFDEATVEELEYYLNHRQSRVGYESMMPVLEVALKAKRSEIETEKPFRLLLVGTVSRNHDLQPSEVEDRVDELIKWWKFKTRTHRALLSDDQKALNMIVTEFKLRMKQDAVRDTLDHDALVRSVLDANLVEPLLVAHKKGRKYVAYLPHNEQNVWVIEQEWELVGDHGEMVSRSEWKLVDNRHLRWHAVYVGARWGDWKVNPVRSTILTDPELNALVDEAMVMLVGKHDRFLPLEARHEDFNVVLWAWVGETSIANLLVSQQSTCAKLTRIRIRWECVKGEFKVKSLYDQSTYTPHSSQFSEPSDDWVLIRRWDDNVAVLKRELSEWELACDTSRALENKYNYLARVAEQYSYDAAVSAAHGEFLGEYGDPELWPGYLKKLSIVKPHYRDLRKALALWAERSLDPTGKSVEEVVLAAKLWGFETDEKLPAEVILYATSQESD